MGRDCEAFNRRLAQLVSEKRKVSFGSVMTHIITRFRFALLRSVVTLDSVERSKRKGEWVRNKGPIKCGPHARRRRMTCHPMI